MGSVGFEIEDQFTEPPVDDPVDEEPETLGFEAILTAAGLLAAMFIIKKKF
ncbi:conserved hypothetical protein [Methanosalsum zhilinae DSM 4017]|uniref:PGF-CTERM archaeal protein-sorting signal domain-containing protein n=1 Tax=Methanosalsum zhilinae (strain DSM 4017 / NBRC 107636 / OCM 62 / WeN5) TaxID=679901 RepID=F7XP12_METZD|nr:PGF-CTERM sorting domain-containing protein [Methanosalsum zhilinae]AEH60206.1 conserved hypothetical protein [Methanosalsum zhilinae DSM 4017]